MSLFRHFYNSYLKIILLLFYSFFGRVKAWADKLGFELSQLGKLVTNVDKFEDSYKSAEIMARDGNALVHEIANDIKAMMASKISAIKVRITINTKQLSIKTGSNNYLFV